jgi:antitoxin PrlF
MVRSRVTSKGQITLPVELRRRYGLQAGDEVSFVMGESGARMVPLRRRSAAELRGMFKATRPFPGKEAIRREIGQMLGEELERSIRRGRSRRVGKRAKP